ncbi:MAG: FAD:protein FMN transferase [Planctomycetes bacterium]|nr:FAD:protein FMN transferase [Planctomycetota bacterium]
MAAKKKNNRREFLKGRAAIDALADVRGSASWRAGDGLIPGSARDSRDRLLVQVGQRAMACEFQVLLNAGQHAGAVDAAMEALNLVATLEEQLSVYRPHSDIAQINLLAAHDARPVEPWLFDLLQQCARWSEATGGAFDITTGPLSKLWGFFTRQGRFPGEEQVGNVLADTGMRHVELDADARTIRFLRPGVALNLGGVGKGYALDRCAAVMSAAGVGDFMIHGGHSSILARGSRRANGAERDWSVALRHPLRPDRRLAEIRLRDQALGTSGSGQQFFYHRGRRYGHVFDPRTGAPAEGVLSATVLAPDAAEADALATAFFVMGVEAVRDYCSSRSHLSAVLVLPGAREGTVALEWFGAEDNFVIFDS